MKLALISDTHFGFKNDNLQFHNAFVKFYNEIFFPTLREKNISTIVHLGDLFDRRKYINFHILYRTRKDFMEQLVNGGYEVHFIVGNHDTYFRDTNEVNSIRELVYDRFPGPGAASLGRFHIYEEPQEVTFDRLRVLIVPWLNTTNMGPGLEMIANSKAPVLMGHLEIAGFHMDQTQVCEHGIDKTIFDKFKKVFSGHFHHASEEGKVRYLGAPYEMTFADLNDPKGFYIFDTDTLELEFVLNPLKMFYRVVYDDREEKGKLMEMNFSEYENKHVRLVVAHKTDPVLHEQWMDKLYHADPADLQIHETMSLDVAEEADEQFLEFDENNKIVVMSDTLTVLNNYVDAMGLDIDKSRLFSILRELYIEACGQQG